MLGLKSPCCRPSRLPTAVHKHPTVRVQASLLQWAVRPTQTKTKTKPAPIIQPSTAQQVQQRVAQHISSPSTTQSLVVMFTAQWCGPCSLVYKELQKLGGVRPPGSLTVLSIDVDEECNKDFASELAITSLPCLVFIGHDPSRKTISTVGPVSSQLIADVLDNKMHLCGANLQQRLRLS